jgi:hypothetical protein
MAIDDKAYRTTVPQEAQQLAAERDLGQPNWFIPGTDAPPYFPPSVRRIFEKVAADAPSPVPRPNGDSSG